MQHRKSSSGRPSGTDGSDFSYRMLVDPRYTKVAKQKSRLRGLILVQVVSQLLGGLLALLTAEKGLDRVVVLSIVVGLVALIAGELGRRHSSASLLKLYMVVSSIATVVSVAIIARSGLSFEALQDQNGDMLKKLEVVEAGRILLSVPIQLFAIITTVMLIQNMSPPMRAS